MMQDKLQLVNFFHYRLYILSFFVLIVLCYVLYMTDAIKESERGAMTVTKRSEPREYEPPSVMFCPFPGFKPSIVKKYNLSIPPQDIFMIKHWLNKESLEKKLFYTRNVQELYEEFQYGDSFTFNFMGIDLKFGDNEIVFMDARIQIELKRISTILNGDCYLIEFKKCVNWKRKMASFYVRYSQNMDVQDVPRGFVIYFTQKDNWHGIATNVWEEHQFPMMIDTLSYNFPLNINVAPLS